MYIGQSKNKFVDKLAIVISLIFYTTSNPPHTPHISQYHIQALPSAKPHDMLITNFTVNCCILQTRYYHQPLPIYQWRTGRFGR